VHNVILSIRLNTRILHDLLLNKVFVLQTMYEYILYFVVFKHLIKIIGIGIFPKIYHI